MQHIDFSEASIKQLITHKVGNKSLDEHLFLSEQATTVNYSSEEHLLKYFLVHAKPEELFCFTHPVGLDLNDVYHEVAEIFEGEDKFIRSSQTIAKLLYELSENPKIKEGELNIAHLNNIVIEDEIVDGVGIFKSETHTPYIKMTSEETGFSIHHEHGFDLKGLDKGCIIFNADNDTGFRIVVVEKKKDAYWKDDFLNVKPFVNEYHNTNQFLDATKTFVTKELDDVEKTGKIDILNRSVDYFKNNEKFNKDEFEEEVFQDDEIIKSFHTYNSTQKSESEVELSDDFEISPQAVKKQARAFKGVLKLDKNFDIHIHGNRELIKPGIERDGRKFYKIYFEEES
ncbi:MAG: nucleoid-associated protein [Balneolales bacterium]